MEKLLRVHPDERMDLEDMEAVGGTLELFDQMRQVRQFVLPEGNTGGAAATDARIFDGFNMSNTVGGTIRLNRGSGVFRITEEGVAYFGVMLGECGDTYKTLDLSGEADGDYLVYIRPVFADGEQGNRVHWNAGGSPSEYVDYVHTRRVLSWGATYISSGAPAPVGAGWVKVWKLTVAATLITAEAGYRVFYFEGDESADVDQWGPGWGGGANDRDADRATYGVKDLHTFAQAMRTKIVDIQGTGSEWWEVPDPTLEDLAVEHHTDGKHLNVDAQSLNLNARTGGATDTDMTFNTLLTAGEHFLTVTAATGGRARVMMDDAGVYSQYSQNPRGLASALTDFDYGEVVAIGPDNAGNKHGMKSTQLGIATGAFQHELGNLNAAPPPVKILEGGAVTTTRGMYLNEAGARYFHPSKQEWNCVEWNTENQSGAGWTPGNLFTWSDTGAAPTGVIMFDTTDWPQWMQLTDIQVKAQLAGGATISLTVTAYRITWQVGAAAPTAALLGSTSTLAAGIQDLTISPVASTGWTHSLDRLYLEIGAPDILSAIYLPRLRWTFTTVSKWAQ